MNNDPHRDSFTFETIIVMQENELIPHLFRTEYRKITVVLCRLFGFDHIETAEDIASDTFLAASELWGLKGLPENPVAWLYAVAKNKARNALKHQDVFQKKVAANLKLTAAQTDHLDIDLSSENIRDSQLRMIFAICHPSISQDAQIGLALRILCGFGIDEIADAFLTNRETINKRLFRAKEKLRSQHIPIEVPGQAEINERLDTVIRTLYLLFNEGYHSASHNSVLRKDLCLEAVRLAHALTENTSTDHPRVNALLALMSFQASRFEARTNLQGETILYDDQDPGLWDHQLIAQGKRFLEIAFRDKAISKYHLEAGIAYWHTIKADTKEKWEGILQLYNHLLQLEYSPIAALNRTYALAKANGKKEAIIEAEKLRLENNHFYFTLLGELYTDVDNDKARECFARAMAMARTITDKDVIAKKIKRIDLP